MNYRNGDTNFFGGSSHFQTTCWFEVTSLQTGGEGQQHEILGGLIKRYWRPVYCYLRRRGYQNDTAKDRTQDFFAEIVLGRELFRKADKEKGRFRTFLLSALNYYLIDVNRRAHTKTGNHGKPVGYLEELAAGDWEVEFEPDLSAEEVFNQSWLSLMLEEVIEKVRQECMAAGRELHWQLFEHYVLEPLATSESAPSLEAVRVRFGLSSTARISNMLVTVKRRLIKALKHHLRATVASDIELDEELRLFSRFF